jgi:hypothetical protein
VVGCAPHTACHSRERPALSAVERAGIQEVEWASAPADSDPGPQSAIEGPPVPKLGSFCAFRTLGPGRPAKLGSFCTIPSVSRRGPGRIGFVLHVSSAGRAMDHTTTFPHIPQLPQVWLRFAHFASGARQRPGEIGFVSHDPPLRRLGVPARHLPPAVEIGFVFQIHPPAGPNWVCSAHCASGVPPAGPFQSAIRNMSLRGVKRRGNPGPPAPFARHFDTSNVRLSPGQILGSPFPSWDLCHSLLMTVSGSRPRRRPPFHR